MTVRAAVTADLERICALLAGAQLPTEGVAAHVHAYLVAETAAADSVSGSRAPVNTASRATRHDEAIVAAIGMERYGETALLRSMVVTDAARGHGVGTLLVRALEQQARLYGVQALVLLTTTADRWFARHGYEQITREAVPPELLASEEFRGACPASAIVMRKALTPSDSTARFHRPASARSESRGAHSRVSSAPNP